MAQIVKAFNIEKAEDGGFIVYPSWPEHGIRIPAFAATDIDVALLYIKDRLNDIE